MRKATMAGAVATLAVGGALLGAGTASAGPTIVTEGLPGTVSVTFQNPEPVATTCNVALDLAGSGVAARRTNIPVAASGNTPATFQGLRPGTYQVAVDCPSAHTTAAGSAVVPDDSSQTVIPGFPDLGPVLNPIILQIAQALGIVR